MFESLKCDHRSKKATYLKRPNLRKRSLSHFNSTLSTRVVCLYLNFLTLLKKSSSQMDREKNFWMKLILAVFLTSPILLTLRIRQPLVDVFSFLPFSHNTQHKISQEFAFRFSLGRVKWKTEQFFVLKFKMIFYLNRKRQKKQKKLDQLLPSK